MPPARTTPYRTSSHVFVMHDRKILALQQAHGLRWWELPGGEVERGETPSEAAARETLEETALRIGPPELLRRWSYPTGGGRPVDCYAFAAGAPSDVIRLSDEHTAYSWITIDDYMAQHCGEELARGVPWVATFLAEMRTNCTLFSRWQRTNPTTL